MKNHEVNMTKYDLINIRSLVDFHINEFKFIKEQFGELIIGDQQFHEKEEIKKVEIKSKHYFEGNMLL